MEINETERRNQRKELFLGSKPCYIVINENKEQVLGFFNKNKALLFQTPNPKSGYFFEDIVEVEGPIGQTQLRDGFLDQYKALRIINKSELPTFNFRINTNTFFTMKDYFSLEREFKRIGFDVQLSDLYGQINSTELIGWCSANSIKQAKNSINKSILKIENVIIE